MGAPPPVPPAPEFEARVRGWRARLGDARLAERLLGLPAVAAALLRRDALRVYEALRGARNGALSALERSALDGLLQDRRAFASPYDGFPLLVELRGFGFRLEGRSDVDPASGTFLATQWLCLLFIPFWSVRSLLVHELTPGLRGSLCEYERVPRSAWNRRWRVLAPCLWALAIGAIAYARHVRVLR